MLRTIVCRVHVYRSGVGTANSELLGGSDPATVAVVMRSERSRERAF